MRAGVGAAPMFLQQKYKEYKEKNAREAWDKKLEKAAKKQFGLDDGVC